MGARLEELLPDASALNLSASSRKETPMRQFVSVFAAAFTLAALFSSPLVHAQTPLAPPGALNFQGRLAKPDGTPVLDGAYTLQITFYDAATGGNIIYSKIFPGAPVRNGAFALVIPGVSSATFNSNAWIGIKIGGDPELSPRTQIVSVPYAMKSYLALTVPDNSLTSLKLIDGAVTTAKLGADAVTSVNLAADNGSLSKLTGGLIQQDANTVAIGGAAGSQRLRVNARTAGDGIGISGTATTAPGLSLLLGNTDMGDLGLALAPGQFSADARANDLVLRSGTGNLLLQNGSNIAGVVLSNNAARFNGPITAAAGVNIMNGYDLTLYSRMSTPSDPGGVSFSNYSGIPLARIYASRSNDASLVFSVTPDNANAMSISNDMRVSIGGGPGAMDARLTVAGNYFPYAISAGGTIIAPSFFSTSDARLKEHIETLPDALSSLLALRGVTYDWNPNVPNAIQGQKQRQYGFLAQEVETVLPALVQMGANGYRAVNYQGIIPVAVEALKAQQTQINTLQRDNDAKAKRLSEVEARNAELEARLDGVMKRLDALEKRNAKKR